MECGEGEYIESDMGVKKIYECETPLETRYVVCLFITKQKDKQMVYWVNERFAKKNFITQC